MRRTDTLKIIEKLRDDIAAAVSEAHDVVHRAGTAVDRLYQLAERLARVEEGLGVSTGRPTVEARPVRARARTGARKG